MPNASHTIREELTGIGVFIGAIWGVFALSYVFPSLDNYGIVPRTVHGLVGIVAAPFLHENLRHIVGNTLPLFVLLVLLAGSKARSWAIVFHIVLLGGFLLWLLGRAADHIGASGLIFGRSSMVASSRVSATCASSSYDRRRSRSGRASA